MSQFLITHTVEVDITPLELPFNGYILHERLFITKKSFKNVVKEYK